MSMSYGNKPANSGSSLSGLSSEIYNIIKPEFVDEGIAELDEARRKGMPKKEVDESKEKIIYKNKFLAYSIAKAVVDHIINNLEISGVKINLDSGVRTLESFAAGVGSNTGSLSSTGGPVIGSVKSNRLSSGTQSNDGKGLVK